MKVRLRGLTSLINAIEESDIVVTVDFTGKERGAFNIKPTITVKDEAFNSVGPVGTYSVSVTLKEKPEEDK
jgi:hypothetical protein